MIVTVTIDTSNAAFDPPGPEMNRILYLLAAQYLSGDLDPADQSSLRILDVNGNTVGSITHKETP